jgi:hypothetical protein
MKESENIKQIFSSHPDAKELYQDTNGIVWASKETAEAQSKGSKVKTIKRSDYFKISKTE